MSPGFGRRQISWVSLPALSLFGPPTAAAPARRALTPDSDHVPRPACLALLCFDLGS